MNTIEHIIEPKRLLLIWQPLDNNKERTRRVVGELLKQEDGTVILRYLTDTADFQQAVLDGFVCFPAFRKTNVEYANGVLETFSLRLPPRSRIDFNVFLDALRIPHDANISNFALLGYSEARLPGDGFSIVNPFDEFIVPCEILSEIAGFRFYLDTYDDINLGTELNFEFEKNNPKDPNAIKVLAGDNHLGYVNRVQTRAFRYWLTNNNLKAVVERKNGRPSQERLHMFVKVW